MGSVSMQSFMPVECGLGEGRGDSRVGGRRGLGQTWGRGARGGLGREGGLETSRRQSGTTGTPRSVVLPSTAWCRYRIILQMEGQTLHLHKDHDLLKAWIIISTF